MQNNFATTRERDFNWHYFLAEAGRREGNRDYKYFGFLEEPPKYLPHEESTSSDHFGPKVNFPVTVPMTNEVRKQVFSI
ncbi:uncharacterized protein CEXT_522221 [Caerostris extrusa]|uniref:Uncharacterized protein n=1 Tax=Caerostris extrusa TaxID=172846 RepID=A0AAV4WJQ5_CAEEX|nr:uncharacterized protein CEXT_522221 [Caerostris extrusa]